jgi:ATP-dependent Clp protease ATP-binding subunit ClpA
VAEARDLTSFGQYSGEAMRVLFAARRAVQSDGGQSLTPDHMLAGILDVPASDACTRLRGAGVPVKDLREDVRGRLAAEGSGDIDAPLSAEAGRVLEHAAAAAAVGHIGSPHILIGILREGTSTASRLLVDAHVTEDLVQPK